MEPWPATAQLSRPCRGTVLETRGQAEERRPTHRLSFSLDLQAEGPDADVALSRLQARLAAVRSALRTLAIEDLEVTSPSTWNRPAQRGRPAITQARLRVSGRLAPGKLQALVRDVGTLEGVRLSPVSGAADASLDASVRRQVIEAAYRDALALARDMGAAIGRSSVEPLEMGLDGREFRPVPMRAMDAAAPPPFNPDELPPVKERLSLRVRFCAT